jgi:hypothetical protein
MVHQLLNQHMEDSIQHKRNREILSLKSSSKTKRMWYQIHSLSLTSLALHLDRACKHHCITLYQKVLGYWAVLNNVVTWKSTFENILEASYPSFPFPRLLPLIGCVVGRKARGIAPSEFTHYVLQPEIDTCFPACAWVTSPLHRGPAERESCFLATAERGLRVWE